MDGALEKAIERAREAGIRLVVHGETVLVRGGREHPDQVAALRAHKAELAALAHLIESTAARKLDTLLALRDRFDARVVDVQPVPRLPLRTGRRVSCSRCYVKTSKVDADGCHWCERDRHLFMASCRTERLDEPGYPWRLVDADGEPLFAGLCVSQPAGWMLARSHGWQLLDNGAETWIRRHGQAWLRGRLNRGQP